MSVSEWYDNREIFITGVTSELGRALLEKLLRSLPNVRIHAVLRSRGGLSKDDRMRSIFASPGYARLREQEPNAIARLKLLEGNLLYRELGLSKDDAESLKNVQVAFHAAGPHDEVFEFCQQLPNLKSIAAASSLFRHRGQISESLQNESIPKNIPLALLRVPILSPAYNEPMPGFVEILRGSTALMIGAGFAFGRSELPAEILPVDLAVNALIVAARERAVRSRTEEPTVYNLPTLGCSWGTLVEKGGQANRKFDYPTFGIRGITSSGLLHWIVVLLIEWMPSVLCDTVLSVCGAKPRCVAEYNKVRKALLSLEGIASRPWPVERNRIHQLHKRLNREDIEMFSICPEIDVESYVLCAAASAKKYCVNETNAKIVQTFTRISIALMIVISLCFLFR